MPRPRPTLLYHFTHATHLPSIQDQGLACDAEAQAGLLTVEVGQRSIKERRRRIEVKTPPYGCVADYVPFYYGTRSVMMYVIDKGQVVEYRDGLEPLVYLVTTVERLLEFGLSLVFTDGNASDRLTRFTSELDELDGLVDWPLIRTRYWANTPTDGDRKRRRAAECLARGPVPWEAFQAIAVKSRSGKSQVEASVTHPDPTASVVVRPDWYY
ncbi:MAG: DUF4433 domain-containing protein [Acidimicrobiales bacterium]